MAVSSAICGCGVRAVPYDGAMREPLLIIGASARAAAQCADRAGYDPLCIDLFADLDLRALAPVRICRPFPDRIPELAAQMPAAPVLLAGAMENHLHIVERLSETRILYGNSHKVLAAVRNPLRVAQILKQCGLDTPAVRLKPPQQESGKTWLVKSRRGSSGKGIRYLTVGGERHETDEEIYYQEYIIGQPVSAVFIATPNRTTLLGVTRQLIGPPWLHAAPFSYAGSVGPLSPDSRSRERWIAIGSALARAFGLLGLFGIDAILAGDQIFPVEVNPRFTSSVEILERAFSLQTVQQHVEACRTNTPPTEPPTCTSDSHGKAIFYAPGDLTVPAELVEFADACNRGKTWPLLADISPAGTPIRTGTPVITMLITASGPPEVTRRLRQLAARVRKILLTGNRSLQTVHAAHSTC